MHIIEVILAFLCYPRFSLLLALSCCGKERGKKKRHKKKLRSSYIISTWTP